MKEVRFTFGDEDILDIVGQYALSQLSCNVSSKLVTRGESGSLSILLTIADEEEIVEAEEVEEEDE